MADKRKEDPAVTKRRELRGVHGQALDWAEKHGADLERMPGEHVLSRSKDGKTLVMVDGAKLTPERLAAAQAALIAAGLKEEPDSKPKK